MISILLKFKECRAFFLFIGLCTFAVGCSSNPSPNDGKQAIQNQIDQDAQGRIKLIEFHKTNGQLAEINGIKVYNLEFKAKIEFTENCQWAIGNFGQQLSFVTAKLVAAPASGFNWNKFLDDADNPGTAVMQGQQVKIYGVIHFEKKENGWTVDRIDINHAIPVANSANSSSQTIPQSLSSPENTTQKQNRFFVHDFPNGTVIKKWMETIVTEPRRENVKLITLNEEPALFPHLRTNAIEEINCKAVVEFSQTGKWIFYSEPDEFFLFKTVLPSDLQTSKERKTVINITEAHEQFALEFSLVLKQQDQGWLLESLRKNGIWTLLEYNRINNLNKVYNDLRNIEAAKNLWALENAKPPGAIPTENDLKPYFQGKLKNTFPVHPAGGHYIINPVGKSAESSIYGKLP